MTDEQIIKALDCCHSELGNMCSICPLFDPDNDYCEDELHKNALNLINRQKAENEWLLQKLQQAKSEAIKEFAENLKEEMRLDDDCNYDCAQCHYDCKDYISFIDNLVKEMTEEEK